MNLIELSNQLKGLSDEQLQQSMQSPAIQPYLVISEMKRREEMRKAYQKSQEEQQSGMTVAQETMQNFRSQPQQGPPQQMQPQGGLGGMQPQMQPMSHGGIVQRMAQGGITDLSDYFNTMRGMSREIPQPEAQMPSAVTTPEEYYKLYPQKTPEEARRQAEVLRPRDLLGPVAQDMEAAQKQYRNKKPSLSETLMRMGLGMAASKNPTFAGAVGEAGLSAMNERTRQSERNEDLGLGALRNRAEIVRAQQQGEDITSRNAADIMTGGSAERNTMANILEASKRAMINAEAERKREEAADRVRKDIAAENQREISARARDAADARADEGLERRKSENQRAKEHDDTLKVIAGMNNKTREAVASIPKRADRISALTAMVLEDTLKGRGNDGKGSSKIEDAIANATKSYLEDSEMRMYRSEVLAKLRGLRDKKLTDISAIFQAAGAIAPETPAPVREFNFTREGGLQKQ